MLGDSPSMKHMIGSSDPIIEFVWRGNSSAVVLKPAGIATQAPKPHVSVESLLREQRREQTAGEINASRDDYLAFPHRLDRPVSGLLLVAWNKRAASLLGQQFESRRVRKWYMAWVQGTVSSDQEIWRDGIRKIDEVAKAEILPIDAIDAIQGAKLAELEMRVVRREAERTLVEFELHTGRMHQIRAQAAARGHAIQGDWLYGSTLPMVDTNVAGALGDAPHHDASRIALHAVRLAFNDPHTGRAVTVESLAGVEP